MAMLISILILRFSLAGAQDLITGPNITTRTRQTGRRKAHTSTVTVTSVMAAVSTVVSTALPIATLTEQPLTTAVYTSVWTTVTTTTDTAVTSVLKTSISVALPPTSTILVSSTQLVQSQVLTSTSIPSPPTSTIIASSTQLIQAPVSNLKNPQHVSDCYQAMGGVSGGVQNIGCKSFLDQVSACYTAKSPWTNPYDIGQSFDFRGCLCGDAPFTSVSPLYQNFSACVSCLQGARTTQSAFGFMSVCADQLQSVANFCRSQNPDAFLFIKDLQHFLGSVDADITITDPPLADVTIVVSQLQPLYTTTPPLDNLAYGNNAPWIAGSLRDVTPSLTTFTSTGPTDTAIITSLVTWLPMDHKSEYNASAAAKSEAQAASSALMSDMASTTTDEASKTTIASQTSCHGPGGCPANTGAASANEPPKRLLLAGLGNVIAMAIARI